MANTFEEIIKLLEDGLDISRVKYREAGGSDPVPYLEGHDVINNANRIFSYRWSSEIKDIQIKTWERPMMKYNYTTKRKELVTDGDGNPVMEQTGVVYATVAVSASMGEEYYTKSDVGVNPIQGSAPEALDMAIKGAVTDGTKRAFRQFGEQFGNSLYDKAAIQEIKQEKAEQAREKAEQERAEAAAKRAAAQAARPSGNGTNGTSKPATQSKAAAPTAQAPAAVKAEAAPVAVNQAEVSAALKTVIPAGAPLAGKTFEEAIKDDFGKVVVYWLQGGIESDKSKKVFKPANVDDEKVAAAAKIVVSARNITLPNK